MASLSSLITVLCMLRILVSQATSLGDVPFFIFGDSLVDAGNNQYLNTSNGASNVFPFGETFFHRPTGRVCDGRIVPDFIAEYANLPLIAPYLQPGFDNYTYGVNFASAGAGVLPETSQGTINLEMQLANFKDVDEKLKKKLGAAKTKKLMSKAVYFFSMGGNDYMHLYFSSFRDSTLLSSSNKKNYLTIVLGNYTLVLKEIYKRGGRKFVFQNVGPLGYMPSTKLMANTTGDNVPALSALAQLHNIALSKLLKRIQRNLPGFKYTVFDYYTTLAERTVYSTKYGFKVGKSACCGSGKYRGNYGCGKAGSGYELCSDPSEYVWFDPGHPTEALNHQLTDLLWHGHPRFTVPYSIKSFFIAP